MCNICRPQLKIFIICNNMDFWNFESNSKISKILTKMTFFDFFSILYKCLVYGWNSMRPALGTQKYSKIFKIVEISVMVQKFLPYIKSEKRSFFPIFSNFWVGLFWFVGGLGRNFCRNENTLDTFQTYFSPIKKYKL